MLRSITTKLAAATAATVALVALGATAASADSTTWVSNGRFAQSVEATCNQSTHQISVAAAASPEPGYDAGQYVHYRIGVKDVTYTNTNAWQWFNWQGPYVVANRTYVSNGITYVNVGNAIPGFVINGVPGHRYYVGMTMQWWNPYSRAWESTSSIADTAYSQYAYGYWLTTASCFT